VAHWAKQIKESRPPRIISMSYRFRCEAEASFFHGACWNTFLGRISSNRFIGAFRSRLHTGWRFPLGLDAGTPPPDPVLMGPVFPCGCVTLPPELALVGGSLGFDWEKAADAADKTKAVVRAISLRHTSHL
jgi:hypothetical protein